MCPVDVLVVEAVVDLVSADLGGRLTDEFVLSAPIMPPATTAKERWFAECREAERRQMKTCRR